MKTTIGVYLQCSAQSHCYLMQGTFTYQYLVYCTATWQQGCVRTAELSHCISQG